MPDRAASTLDDVFRREWPLLVAAAARIVGDLGRAEEVAQDVMVTALDRWPFSGVPDRPGAWLLTAARNRARNVVRDEARGRIQEPGGRDGRGDPTPRRGQGRPRSATTVSDSSSRAAIRCSTETPRSP